MATKTVNRLNGTATPNAEPGLISAQLPQLNKQMIEVKIKGMTPLIVQAWSEKAKRMMLDKHMKKAQSAKEAKDPKKDYEACLYTSDEGWHGFPTGAFKAAIVGACRQAEGITMTAVKRICFVRNEGYSTAQDKGLIRIHGKPRMRQDMMRNESGVADIRFLAEFPVWEATLTIEFNASCISAEQIIHLVELAGYGEGVGGHRPSSPKNCTGDNGRWEVVKGK